MNNILDYLKNKQLVWQGQDSHAKTDQNSSGYKELDTLLRGGFPQQGVVDIHSKLGIGEFRLVQPMLQQRHQQQQNYLVFIAPPFHINAEMLAANHIDLSRVLIIRTKDTQESLWAAEQCLKSGCCHSVISWAKTLEVHQIKRLQLAAKQSQALHIFFRNIQQATISLPVTLAMTLAPQKTGLKVTVNKQIGGHQQPPKSINMMKEWPVLTIQEPDNVVPFSQQQAG